MRRVLAMVGITALLATGCGAAKKANEARKAVGDIKKTANNIENNTTGDKKLDAFLDKADKAQKSTYTAEYKLTSKSSSSDTGKTFRIVQDPPRGRLEIHEGDSATIIIDDGTDSFTCFQTEDGAVNCQTQKGGGGNGQAFTAFTGGFSPIAILALVKTYVPLLGDKVKTRHFSKSVGGDDVDCVEFSITDSGDTQVSSYCINGDGVVAYSDDGDQISELTDYSTSADDSEFVPPKSKEATTTTSEDTTDTSDPNAADSTTSTTES